MISSLSITIKAIEETLEEFSWLFIRLSQNNGTLALPEKIAEFFGNSGLPIWASYYHSQDELNEIVVRCVFSKEESSALEEKIRTLSVAEVEPLRAEIQEKFDQALEKLSPKGFDFDSLALKTAGKTSSEFPSDSSQQELQRNYIFITSFLLHIFNFLTLVSHGRSMQDIVQAAIAGCNESFFEAIEVDRTVLIAIPFFQKRLLDLQLGGDRASLDKLSKAMGVNSIGAQYTYPELRLAFSLLHRTEHLKDMPIDDLFDLCLRLKVYKGDSVKALTKLRSEFLKSQPRPA